MVETLGPSGCDLNSHLSDQRGQMSALNNGARMGILAVLGTHVEDYSLLVKKYIYIYIQYWLTMGHQLHGLSLRQDQPS